MTDMDRAMPPQIHMLNRAQYNQASLPHLHLLQLDKNMKAGRRRREDMRRKLMISEQVPTLLWAANLKLGEHSNHPLQPLADTQLSQKYSQDTERRNMEVK